ncbi:MAG: ABC transporter permease subunit [Acidimicrobiales bacterium]|nr:ABC transporter permease subunit [Acidimicrobiales bacterium]
MTTAIRPLPRSARRSNWMVITKQELVDLWLSSKGLSVLFGFTSLLAILAYLASADAGINLLDARESVGVVVQTAIGLGTLSALVVSADAISGERERGTLEALLVTPVARLDIVAGKLLAATTMWLAALLVALPFVAVMADGPGVAFDAVAVLVVAGTLVAAALTALGLAVSSLAMSNRVSLAASIALLLLLATPSQLPAVKANGALGPLLIQANPVSAGLQLATNVLVKQEAWADQWAYLISPIVAAVGLTAIAIALSSRLELGGSR